MLRPKNDFGLHFGGEASKIVAVATDPDDEVAVLLRISPRIFQNLSVSNVDLHFKSAAKHISLDK